MQQALLVAQTLAHPVANVWAIVMGPDGGGSDDGTAVVLRLNSSHDNRVDDVVNCRAA